MITFDVNYGKLRGGARIPKRSFVSVSRVLKKLFLKSGDWKVSVAFISQSEIKKINQAYRGQNKPTDVLSFTHAEDGVLGEVLICYQMAKEQAKKQRIPVREEVIRLLVHGILHLMGYDHIKKKEAEEMFALQEVILSKVKI